MVEVQRLWGRPFLHSSESPQWPSLAESPLPVLLPRFIEYIVRVNGMRSPKFKGKRKDQRASPRMPITFLAIFFDFGERGTQRIYTFRPQMKSLDSLCRLPIARTACCGIRPPIYHICYRNSACSFHSSRGLLSGHNKWSTIKHKKGIINARRILMLIL